MTAAANDPRVVDDKMAEARERAERIDRTAGQPEIDAEPPAPTLADLGAAPVAEIGGALPQLKKASQALKEKIDEAKRRNDMPLDEALGDPDFERKAADGRFDLPEEEED